MFLLWSSSSHTKSLGRCATCQPYRLDHSKPLSRWLPCVGVELCCPLRKSQALGIWLSRIARHASLTPLSSLVDRDRCPGCGSAIITGLASVRIRSEERHVGKERR